MSAIFEMVKYHNKEYPTNIPLKCEEISSHLDINKIEVALSNYSLHTEYSYGKRNLSSIHYSSDSQLSLAHKDGVPQLWKNEQWATEFATFLANLVDGFNAPSVIEIHPPFTDYTDSLDVFIERYKVFETKIREYFPNTQILIENRCGSVYVGGKFLISRVTDILALSKAIDKENLNLKFALDIPQLYTAHNCNNEKEYLYYDIMKKLNPALHNIGGVHLWGKKRSSCGRKVAHCGDLRSYFEDNIEIVERFLEEFNYLFDDGILRKLVLEVNSGNDDLDSIINDLISVGITFK